MVSYLSKVADFSLLHLPLAPDEFREDVWHHKTRVPCGVVCMILARFQGFATTGGAPVSATTVTSRRRIHRSVGVKSPWRE